MVNKKVWSTEGTVLLIQTAGDYMRENQGSVDQLNNLGHDKYGNWATTINAANVNYDRVDAQQVKDKWASVNKQARDRFSALRKTLRAQKNISGMDTATVLEKYPEISNKILNKNLGWMAEYVMSFKGDPALELNPPRSMGFQHLPAHPPSPTQSAISEQRSQRDRHPSRRAIAAQETQALLSPNRPPRRTPAQGAVEAAPSTSAVLAAGTGAAPAAGTGAAPAASNGGAPAVSNGAAPEAAPPVVSNATAQQPRSALGAARNSSRSGNGGGARRRDAEDVVDDGSSPLDRAAQRRRTSGAPSVPRIGRGSSHEHATLLKELIEAKTSGDNEAAKEIVQAFQKGTVTNATMKATTLAMQIAQEAKAERRLAMDQEREWLLLEMKAEEFGNLERRHHIKTRTLEQRAEVEKAKVDAALAEQEALRAKQAMQALVASLGQPGPAPATITATAMQRQEGGGQEESGAGEGGEGGDQ